jgi:hypothetical protein
MGIETGHMPFNASFWPNIVSIILSSWRPILHVHWFLLCNELVLRRRNYRSQHCHCRQYSKYKQLYKHRNSPFDALAALLGQVSHVLGAVRPTYKRPHALVRIWPSLRPTRDLLSLGRSRRALTTSCISRSCCLFCLVLV